MSINWSIRDLARQLVTEQINVVDVRVGDIVIADYGVYQVTRIAYDKNKRVHFYDEDENGTSPLAGAKLTIVARAAVKPYAKTKRARTT